MIPNYTATALSILTIILLVVLTAVWIKNYREFGSQLILGLIAFGVVLLIENLVAVYFSLFTMGMLFAADPTVELIVAIMRGLQFIAVAFLTYVTLQ